MIAVVDYGAGNLTSVCKGFAAAGADVQVLASPARLDRAAGIVVPGVGHFSATAALGDDWRSTILERVRSGVPLLGICLGMQWLFDGSEEDETASGLGLMKGTCVRIAATRPLKVPHVGWNTIRFMRTSGLTDGIADGTHMYFTHTFAAPLTPEAAAYTSHGQSFAAIVERGNVCGVQFHPEKSSGPGLRLLHNFVRLTDA